MEPEQLRAAIIVTVLVLAASGVVVAAIAFTGQRDEAPDDLAEPSREPPIDAIEDPTEEDPTSGEDADPREDEGGSPDVVRIDFDGACSVEVDVDGLSSDPRPWQFDECTGAPVALTGDDQRWIAVVASLDRDRFDEAAARRRATELGFDEVLWSSHYPSLNPGFWVVFDGPFTSQDAARDAADDIGGGSYPRVLSDVDDDRYCAAVDGCELSADG